MSKLSGPRTPRGVVFPSPVVILSVVAVAVAALAFVLTRHSAPTEREVATVDQSQTPSSSDKQGTPGHHHTKPSKPKPPPVDRSKVYVEVYNNSGITGLAGTVGAKATTIGWKVVGTDNWYGSVPATTVYYPKRLEDAGKKLALDLGIRRTAPAVDPMKADRLTIILTGPLAAG